MTVERHLYNYKFSKGYSEIKKQLRKALKSVYKRFGYQIMLVFMLYDWRKKPEPMQDASQRPLPDDATSTLVKNNPRLVELQARYADFDAEVTTPLIWTDDYVSPADMLAFRGDNAYVWQLRGTNMHPVAYTLTTYYIKSIDKLGLLDKLQEDDYFGSYVYPVDDRLVSRDLLDSILELTFLESHLQLSTIENLTVLDIGAGYGRLAHRTINAFPNCAAYLCTDAFAQSTFIADYYLHFRNIEDKAHSVPLYAIEETLRGRSIDIAVNIHSFSECQLSAIAWWLSLLQANRVKYLMVVPNARDHGGECLQTNDGKDFGPLIEKHGYTLIAKEPKYKDPVVQKYAVNPTYYYLFALQG